MRMVVVMVMTAGVGLRVILLLRLTLMIYGGPYSSALHGGQLTRVAHYPATGSTLLCQSLIGGTRSLEIDARQQQRRR